MKKLCTLLTLFLFLKANAQLTEGTLKYSMKLEGNQSDISAQLLGNTTVSIYFKKDKALMEMTTPAYSMRTLTDASGILMLMDAAGQKFFSRKTKDDLASDKASGQSSDPVVVYTHETKKILGYDCKKAYLTVQGNRGPANKMTIWSTDKIRNIPGLGPVNAEVLAKLKGMALEIEMEQNGVKSRMIATGISAKPVADVVFNLSTAGYTERKIPLAPKK